MGLFSSLGNAIKSIGTGTKELFAGGITQLPKNIGERIVNKVEPLIGKRSLTENEKTIIGGTAVAAGTLAFLPIAPVVVPAVAKAALSVGKVVVPTTPKGILITAVVAPVVATAVINNPIGAAKTIGKVVSAQMDAGKLIANPSKDGIIDFVKEHPVTSGVVAAAGVVAVGGAVASVAGSVGNYLNRKATKENTDAILKSTSEPVVSVPNVINSQPTIEKTPTNTDNQLSEPVPVTPVTQTVAATALTGEKKKRRRRKTKQVPAVNQKVSISVNNSDTTRYLNRGRH